MSQVILYAAATCGSHHAMGAGARPHLGSFSPCAQVANAEPRGADTARASRWALDAAGQQIRRRRDGSWDRHAGMLAHSASGCISEGNSGPGDRAASGLVTSALQPVTSALQARHAKYIFASQNPSAPGICVIPACNVRQTPSFFPFDNSLSYPVEQFFDRTVHIPDLTDNAPVGNSIQKAPEPPQAIIRYSSANLESGSAQ
jgi:hypothetical protein